MELSHFFVPACRFLNSNSLGGVLPSTFVSLLSLQSLVTCNQNWKSKGVVFGPISAWLSNLTSLTYVDVGDTGLTGTIPS